jgi:DNA polymerase-3 subunit beta
VKLLGSEKIEIETDKESAIIKGGKSTFNVLGDNPEDFPDIPGFREDGFMTIDKGDFKDIVKRVAVAAATESTRYALNGVLLSLDKNKLVAVAADGKRLAKLECKVKANLKIPDNVIIPTRALGQFYNMVGEEDKEVRISVTEKGCIAKCGRGELFARLVEGHYPPYEDAIPKEFSKSAELEVEALERAMMQAALMTTEESRAVKLFFSGSELKVTSFSAQTGRAEIEMAADYSGEDLEIAFNPSFILDYLKGAPAEKVTLHMIDKEKPAMFRDSHEFIYIVMPVSIG